MNSTPSPLWKSGIENLTTAWFVTPVRAYDMNSATESKESAVWRSVSLAGVDTTGGVDEVVVDGGNVELLEDDGGNAELLVDCAGLTAVLCELHADPISATMNKIKVVRLIAMVLRRLRVVGGSRPDFA